MAKAYPENPPGQDSFAMMRAKKEKTPEWIKRCGQVLQGRSFSDCVNSNHGHIKYVDGASCSGWRCNWWSSGVTLEEGNPALPQCAIVDCVRGRSTLHLQAILD